MTKAKKTTPIKPAKKSFKAAPKSLPELPPLALVGEPIELDSSDVNKTLVGLTDSAVRTLSVLSATLMFAQPQFLKEANPTNIIGLADLFFKYSTGRVEVQQPEEADLTTPSA